MQSARHPHHHFGAPWDEVDDTAIVGPPTPGDAGPDVERAAAADVAARLDADEEAGAPPEADLHETLKLLASGGVAGAFSKTCTAPLSRLTILYQVAGLQARSTHDAPVPRARALSVRAALREVARREGVRALWKGNGVTMLHRLPYSAANFWVYESVSEAWKRHLPARGPLAAGDVARRLASGGVAGMAACALAYPLDLIRTRLTAQGAAAAAGGPFGAAAAGAGGGAARLHHHLHHHHHHAHHAPLHLPRLHAAAAAQAQRHYYRGVGHALAAIVRAEGVRGLYRGLGATLAQVAPSLAINYAAYETARSAWLARSPGRSAPTVGVSLACGSAAGLASSTATFPLDLVRRRLQLQGRGGAPPVYGSWAAAVRDIAAREGLAGFYAGILPEYYKVVPGVAIAFCTYEVMKRALGVRTNATER